MNMTSCTETFWYDTASKTYYVIDQRYLPHEFIPVPLRTIDDAAHAISDMIVRGAPLIGITAAVGMLVAVQSVSVQNIPSIIEVAYQTLLSTRPTAINLKWALDEMRYRILENPSVESAEAALKYIIATETQAFRDIAKHGVTLLRDLAATHPHRPVQILTHCNAGWLACVEYGTALAPIYKAHEEGIDVHVWVDETRPLNQGARLTAWELGQRGIPHTVIVDNAGGHLMQKGYVDIVFVGADRVSKNGDTANKIGTYLKALAAKDNGIPFYVALPSSTFDWQTENGVMQIPVEERNASEVSHVCGWDGSRTTCVQIIPKNSPVANPAFDITPAHLITGFITERGIFKATVEDLQKTYPEKF